MFDVEQSRHLTAPILVDAALYVFCTILSEP